MAVFVDNMRAGYGRMIMCHMVADTRLELLAMADAISVARKWIQDYGTTREHFDISLAKRALAVAAGAQEVTVRQLGLIVYTRRDGRNGVWKRYLGDKC